MKRLTSKAANGQTEAAPPAARRPSSRRGADGGERQVSWPQFPQHLIFIVSWAQKGSHSCCTPISSRAAFCKVIFLYLLKLLFKEEFLIITQLQRADTVWLCLPSFS